MAVMKGLRRLSAVAASACLLAPPVAALEILPTQDDRVVSWILQNGTPEQLTPGPGFPVFAETLNIVGGPSVSQNTSIGPTQMSGSGAAFVNTDEATNAVSVFDVTFRVDEGVAFALSGAAYGGVDSEVVLSGPTGVIFEAPPSQGGAFPFFVTGTLVPGVDYRLRLALEVPNSAAGYGEWQFAFDTTALPEPSNLVALGAALLVAAARRRAV